MPLSEMLPPLLAGAAVTLEITLVAAAIGLVCAVLAGLARLSPVADDSRLLRPSMSRSSAARQRIVQLFFAFFVLPLAGIRRSLSSPP